MAPIIAALAKWGLGTLATAVVSKGKEVVEEKLGVNLDDALGTEAGRIKLKQLEMEHEQFLIEAGQSAAVRDLEYFREEVGDKKSARLRDSEFIKAGMRNWRAHGMFILAIFAVFALVQQVLGIEKLDEFAKGVITLVLGRFLGYLDNIYNFEFGTTRGSREKDATIDKLTKDAA